PADVTTSGDSVYNKRTFNFSGITTDTWYPGTYAAKISLGEYNASLEMTFIVGVDGRVSSADLTAPLTYSGAYETTSTPAQTTAGPAETAQPIETIPLSSSATAAPAETKSPVPIAGILAGAFAAAAYFRRH
ncbi:MAG: hypothetical protein Q4Q04_06675, partial [Methanocorpusculum sp.]|nr:hypothetical protein [Methanocorpusculum sp.]